MPKIENWKKYKMLLKSYRVKKILRPAVAHEPAQKHKVTPGILGWLTGNKKIPITEKTNWKMHFLKLHQDLAGANELISHFYSLQLYLKLTYSNSVDI